MINVKQVREVFNATNRAHAYSEEGFKKITDLSKFEDKASVDVALICGEFDEVDKSEVSDYANVKCDKYPLVNGKVLIHRYDI